jgi:hypothetical protein
MAIVRCDRCGLNINRTKKQYYATPFKPVGYPDTAIICGIPGCDKPGLVWLETNQYNEYKKGNRIFDLPTNATKLKVI